MGVPQKLDIRITPQFQATGMACPGKRQIDSDFIRRAFRKS